MARKPVDLVKAARDAAEPAKEVLGHFYRRLLDMPPFTLSDGTQVIIKKYIEPGVNENGEASCGVDAILSNGSHLEFTLRNSGWGKAFVKALAYKRRDAGREK